MECVLSKHDGRQYVKDAHTIYLGNALCKGHFSAAKNFVKGCKNPGRVGSSSLIDVLESQAQCGS